MVFIEQASYPLDTVLMVGENVTNRHHSFALGIKVPGVVRDGEFTFQNAKAVSILRNPKFHLEFLIFTCENYNYFLILARCWQSFRFNFLAQACVQTVSLAVLLAFLPGKP